MPVQFSLRIWPTYWLLRRKHGPDEVPCLVATQDTQDIRELGNQMIGYRMQLIITLDSQCIENTIGYCYAAPVHQIQEVYVGSGGSLLKIQLSMNQMQGSFLLMKFIKVPALTIAGSVFRVCRLLSFHKVT